MMTGDVVHSRMQELVGRWQAEADQRSVFLSCYCLMTGNMFAAIERREFVDPDWTRQFVNHFADYYFTALADYERTPAAAPGVWQIAHDTCRQTDVWPLQQLLLGINAHINYDLVLTLDEILRPEWPASDAGRRAARLADYLRVNYIIARTIDAVQDDVLEQRMPSMRFIDAAFGPADEWLLSRLLRRWRGRVWSQALTLLATDDPQLRRRTVLQVERGALRRARAIRHPNRLTSLSDIVY